jgi:starvation-inducible DNA-binding protein
MGLAQTWTEMQTVLPRRRVRSVQEVRVSGRVDFAGSGGQARGGGSSPADQYGVEIRKVETLKLLPIALELEAREVSCESLNRILADIIVLYSLYKKHHWLMGGDRFHSLRAVLDRHAKEQLELTDLLAERVHTLGGIAVSDPRHVAEVSSIPRPPDGAEGAQVMVLRLLEAHEIIIEKVRDAIVRTAANRDDGTTSLLVGEVLRCNERQVCSLCEHTDMPLTRTW